MNNKKTIIISDFHLCGHKIINSEKFLALTKEPTIKRIILCGDIFHSMQFKNLKKNEWEIIKRIQELKISEEKEIVYIFGNHEKNPKKIEEFLKMKLQESYTWETPQGKYIAIHGHQFYSFKKEAPFLSKIIWLLEEFALRILPESFTHSLKQTIGKKIAQTIIQKFRNNAFTYAKKENASALFCGHAHFEEITKKDGIIYCNTGTWKDDPAPVVVVFENGNISLEYR